MPATTTTHHVSTTTDPTWGIRLAGDGDDWSLHVPVADPRSGPLPRESLRGRWTDGTRTFVVERPRRHGGRYRVMVVDEHDGRLVMVARSHVRGAGWQRFDVETGTGVPLVHVRPAGRRRFVAHTPDGVEVGRVGHRWPPLRDDLGVVRRWVERVRSGPVFELTVHVGDGPVRDATLLGLLLPDLCRDRRHPDSEDPLAGVLDLDT